jgi:serine/threonine protein kinase/tetratricopeptide (TPR) repeat protein
VTDEPLESLVSDVAHSRIGKYEIQRPLGSGAMGMVYLATDTLLERDVALKVMVPAIARDPDQKHRFEREAKAVARMTHPNVVTVYDFGYHHDGSPYIAMELLKGQDLQELMRQGSLELDRKVGIMVQVLDGLGHAHQAGIVHRDVKPANIFVRTDGTVKIMDFGVARLATSSMTGTGSIVGTADYMSPEQVKGEHVDGRSDLFSVGCMLFELLAGERPFHADNLMTIFYRITHEEPNFGLLPPGPSYARLLPIVRRALGKTAAARYESAEEFATALREFQRGEVAPPPVATAAPPPVATAPPRPTTPPAAPATWPPTSRTAAVSAGAGGSGSAALPRLLRDLYVGRKSGLLHFVHGEERRSVRFRKGQIVNASSTVVSERLGPALLRHGLLAEPEVRRASELAEREGRRLGTALVEMGLMDRGKLEDALASQVRDILLVVFSRSDGTFSFEETSQEAPPDEETTLRLSTGEMILEAVRRVSDAAAVRTALGDIDRVLALSTDPLLRFQKITFTPTDGYVLSRVDGIVSAREVIQLVSLPQEEVERSLFGLLCTGVLEYLEATRTRAPRPRKAAKVEAAPEPPPAAGAAPKEPAKPVDEAEARRAAEARRREVVQAFDGLKTKTHFEVLGIARNATETQVKEAYFRLAKRFHPDVQHDPALADMHDKLETIFIGLGEAYEVLRNAQSRASYETQLGPSGIRPPTAQAAPQPSGAGARAAAPPSAAPAEERHPHQQQGEANVQAAIRSAEKLMAEERYWDAIQTLEQALPGAEGKGLQRVRVLLARVYLKNPKWVKRAEEVLQTVVQEDPKNAEAYFVLGTIYKGGGLRNRAVSMFRKVMELQPGHEEAVAELTALGEEEGASGSGEGLIKKLFGKS